MNFLTKNIRIISIAVFAMTVVLVFIFLQGGNKAERSLFCFDTLIDIKLSGKNADAAADEIEQELSRLENTYSKYRSSSLISEFNSLTEGETFSVSNEMRDLITHSCEISRFTDGAFDITTSKLSDLWHIKTATAPPAENDITATLEHTGYEKIILTDNTLTKTDVDVDFGGILKGVAADKVRETAQKHGIKSGIVNLGGNVCLIGSKDGKPWIVGVVNPFSPSEIYLTIEAENTNVITSGAYQRYFEYGDKTYHHIISPETGYPAESDVASVTVISEDGTLADALSTAVYVLGSERGMKIVKEYGVEVIIIKKDGSVVATELINYKLNN